MRVRHVAAWLTWVIMSPALAAPRLALLSHSTIGNSKDPENSVLLREIPRQALIISATEDFATCSIDLTLEPQAMIQPDDVLLDFTRKLDPVAKSLTIKLLARDGKTLAEEKISPGFNSASVVSLADVGRLSEAEIEDHWRELIGKQLGAVPIAPRWSVATTQPAETSRLLETMDFSHAFLAARLLHESITVDGESVGRLSALSRAYINLGESTRHLFGGQADAALGRGLVYANRLVRLADKEPLAFWTRAYAEAIIGLPSDSDADLQRAADLAGGNAPPTWAMQLHDFNHCRTAELQAAANSPLTAYLAWRTIEPCQLNTLIINDGTAVLALNPGALRVFDLDMQGSLMHRQMSVEAPRALYRLIATLADEKTVPPNGRDLAAAAATQRFSPAAILTLLSGLESIPNDTPMPLSFATYVSLVRDCQLVDAYHELRVQSEELGLDPHKAMSDWLLLLDHHRSAPLLKTFLAPAQQLSQADFDAIEMMSFHDMGLTLHKLKSHLALIGLSHDPHSKRDWDALALRMADATTWDYSLLCRTLDRPNGQPPRALTLLDSISPDQTTALATKIECRDPSVVSRLDAIEKEYASDPVISASLGYAYGALNRPDDAIRVLKRVVGVSPDHGTYWLMSLAYASKKDSQGWRDLWEEYLHQSSDDDVYKPLVAQQLALALRSRGQMVEALKCEEQSPRISWGMQITYANTLARCGKYDQAWQVLKAEAETGNGDSSYLLPFCVATGHGDLATAHANADMFFQRPRNDEVETMNGAILEADVGMIDSFYRDAQIAFKAKPSPLSALLAALGKLEQKDGAAAKSILDSIRGVDLSQPTGFAYAQCFDQLRACISDPKHICMHAGGLVQPPEEALNGNCAGALANCCYVQGRQYELNGMTDEAKFWYRTSIDEPTDDFGLMPLAAIALKRLGEPIYP